MRPARSLSLQIKTFLWDELLGQRGYVAPAHLQDELHHLSVDQAVDRLPVDVRDEVTGTQSGFLRRSVVLHVLTGSPKKITDWQ